MTTAMATTVSATVDIASSMTTKHRIKKSHLHHLQ